MKRLAVFFLLLPLGLSAQAPRGFYAWWDRPVARNLNLTDTQLKQIRATVRQYRDHLIDIRASLEKAEGDIQDAFNDEPVDTKKADEAINRLANARADLTRTLSEMNLKLRTIITLNQWRELQRRRPPNQGLRQGPAQRQNPRNQY